MLFEIFQLAWRFIANKLKIMKRILSISLLVSLIAISFLSCKKGSDKPEKSEGLVAFEFSVNQVKSALKSVADSGYIHGITNVIVTIEDLDGNVVKNSEKIEIYNMNGYYISKPISLIAGGYKLTRFFVLDANNNVVYASPIKGSPKDNLVDNPLPISFTAQKDVTTKLVPEVVSTADSRPEDFGYVTFSFEISQTFDFLLGVFVYNDALQNYELTPASLAVLSDTDMVYSTQLTANSNINTVLSDTLGITNKITLPERYNTYTIKISKPGYIDYSKTFTKEELRLQYRKEDKGPLVVILEKQENKELDLTQGLVAYYPFDGDANDYMGTNNGIEYSQQVYTQGVKGLAHDFNGSTDYIKLTNTLSVSNGLTFSFWVKSRGAYSTENNGSVISKYNMANPQKLCLGITTFGGIPWGNQLDNFVLVQFFENGTQYGGADVVKSTFDSSKVAKPQLFSFPNPQNLMINTWVNTIINVTPTEILLYLNGTLCVKKTREYSVYFDDSTEPTYLGNCLSGGEGSNNHFNGLLDNFRIYNRPLTEEEIQYIYLNKY
jgi:hypothetical protein